MNQVLAGLPIVWCCIDDFLLFSSTPQEHLRHLQVVFEWLRKWGLHLHHGKCKFFHDCLPYFGYMIVLGRLVVQQTKVDALQKTPTPNDDLGLCFFFGLANYYY